MKHSLLTNQHIYNYQHPFSRDQILHFQNSSEINYIGGTDSYFGGTQEIPVLNGQIWWDVETIQHEPCDAYLLTTSQQIIGFTCLSWFSARKRSKIFLFCVSEDKGTIPMSTGNVFLDRSIEGKCVESVRLNQRRARGHFPAIIIMIVPLRSIFSSRNPRFSWYIHAKELMPFTILWLSQSGMVHCCSSSVMFRDKRSVCIP